MLWAKLIEAAMNPVRHLYAHIPFCPSICPYCSFHVLPVKKLHFEQLLRGLKAEHGTIANQLDLDTLFLGGGTPTALPADMLEELLLTLLPGGNPKGGIETTLECNPSTLSKSKAEALLRRGATRLSIGAQALDPAVLKTLGRTHNAEAIEDCVRTAREAGFQNLNIDLIFGVPGQSLESWKSTLEGALALGTQHISCYGLTYEEDTDFFMRHKRGELRADNELETTMFTLGEELLTGVGFVHYETSNYARAGFECKHNFGYWRGKDYHGIGPSAVGTVSGLRRRNGKFLDGSWSPEFEEKLSVETLASERMALGLRTREGIAEDEFEARFGYPPRKRWEKEISTLVDQGLLCTTPTLHLTPRGRLLSDEVAVHFV